MDESAGKKSGTPVIMSYNPPAQKGGAPGYYMLSDGTKLLEQDLDINQIEDFGSYGGVGAYGDRLVGKTYGSAPAQQAATNNSQIYNGIGQMFGGGGKVLTPEEIEMLRTMMGAQSGNR